MQMTLHVSIPRRYPMRISSFPLSGPCIGATNTKTIYHAYNGNRANAFASLISPAAS